MTKFFKKLRSSYILEWQNEYIDYKLLKNLIKSYKKSIASAQHEDTIISNNENLDPINVNDIYQENINRDTSTSNIKNKENLFFMNLNTTSDDFIFFKELFTKKYGEFIQKFLYKFDTEIRKFYLFYCTIERELYLQINTILHRRENYSNCTLVGINIEFDNLVKILHVTKSFCIYINDNMMVIKKILKKFDKNFNNIYGSITSKFLKLKLDLPNSDINYMLQFKIIDEVNTLVEDMMKDLVRLFKLKVKLHLNNSKKNSLESIDIRVDSSKLLQSNLIEKSNNTEISSSIEYSDRIFTDNNYLIRNIKQKILELRNYTRQIDEATDFRAKIKDWNSYIKNGYSIVSNNSNSSIEKAAHRSMMVSGPEDDEVLKKFLTTEDTANLSIDEALSTENKRNVVLTFIHTFIYMMLNSVALVNLPAYLEKFNGDYAVYSGLVIGLTPLSAILSTLILSKWSNYSYKSPLIISVMLFVIGSLLYAWAYNFDSITMLILSRVILGLGSARTVNRRYLIQFTSKNRLVKYSFYYSVCSTLGLAVGPLLSFVSTYIYKYKIGSFYFNQLTYPGWIGLFASIILLLMYIFAYHDPLKNNFHIFEMDKEPKNLFSKDEKIMINEIDNKLNEINFKNKFTSTNLVQTNIEAIKYKQKTSFSYISKCFFILLLILLTIRLCNESLLVIFPYYLIKKNYSIQFVSLYLFFTITSAIPFSILLKKFTSGYPRERKILFYLLLANFIFSLLCTDIIYNSEIKYCICFTFLYIISFCTDSIATSLIGKIIPPDWEILTVNVGFFITISSGSARASGAFMQTLSELASNNYMLTVAYCICGGILFIIILLFIINYSELRVKALARILKNSNRAKV